MQKVNDYKMIILYIQDNKIGKPEGNLTWKSQMEITSVVMLSSACFIYNFIAFV